MMLYEFQNYYTKILGVSIILFNPCKSYLSESKIRTPSYSSKG